MRSTTRLLSLSRRLASANTCREQLFHAAPRELALATICIITGCACLTSSFAQSPNPLAATVDRKAASARTGPAETSPGQSSASNSTAPQQPAAPQVPPTDAAADPDSDEAVLDRLPTLSTDHLSGLTGLYQRLGNEKMAAAVSAELNRRGASAATPNAPSNRAEQDWSPSSSDGSDNQPDSPFDATEDQADRLLKLGRASDAVTLLENSKARLSKGRAFPLEAQLASAYLASGRKAEAVTSFQSVAASSAYPAVTRSEAGNELARIQLSDEIAATYAALQTNDRKAALQRARSLSAAHPGDRDVDLLLAQALTANGMHREALPLMESLKTTTPPGQAFEAQADYADALYNSGQLERARAEYDQISHSRTETAAVRAEAVATSKEIFKKTADTLSVDGEYLNEAEGDRFYTRVDASAEVRKNVRVGASGWHDRVELSDERSVRTDSGSNTGAYAFVRPKIGNHHFMDVRVGGADHGELLYALAAGREPANDLFWGGQVGYYGNHSAVNSLQLIALDGREDRLAASISGPLPFGLKLSARTGGRRIYAKDAELGDGWFADIEIGRTLWHDKANRRSLQLAYQANYESFDARRLSAGEVRSLGLIDATGGELIGNELIEPRYHPHGINVSFNHRINDRLDSYLGAGVNYDFADDEIDWSITGGASYSLAAHLDLLFELGYYSDGTAAANDSSEVIVANVGLRYFY